MFNCLHWRIFFSDNGDERGLPGPIIDTIDGQAVFERKKPAGKSLNAPFRQIRVITLNLK